MKNILLTATTSALLFAGTAFADVNINSFAYQLQKADHVMVNAQSSEGLNNDMVIGSQVINTKGTLNVNGKAKQQLHTETARLNAASLRNTTAGLQVIKANGAINANGTIEQLMIADDVAVVASDAQNAVIGAQVVRAKGTLNINGETKQMMFSDNVTVELRDGSNSVVGAQVITSK
jgi:hypothetical protein